MARAMVELVTDDTVRGRQSIGARKTAESLSWENELDELDAIYRDIIGANGEKSPRGMSSSDEIVT